MIKENINDYLEREIRLEESTETSSRSDGFEGQQNGS
jgi:hypothetical protein